jgi:hypothetical protein
MAAKGGTSTYRIVRRVVGGGVVGTTAGCCYVAYKYRPRSSTDVDYHESLVSHSRTWWTEQSGSDAVDPGQSSSRRLARTMH